MYQYVMNKLGNDVRLDPPPETIVREQKMYQIYG